MMTTSSAPRKTDVSDDATYSAARHENPQALRPDGVQLDEEGVVVRKVP
jgi:hypothetical protein